MANRLDRFVVDVSDNDVADMRARIKSARWAADFGNDAWAYGVERKWLEGMADYWGHDYDWRRAERFINSLPNYKVCIGEIPIHFLHVRGRGPRPIPLILSHGWPWTFLDWKDLIGPLSDPAAYGGDAADAFDLVIPSLPGAGFSTPLQTAGVDLRAIGQLWVRLMRDILGYDRFAAAGGDWGSLITAELGHAHPEALIGVEMTLPMMPGSFDPIIPDCDYADDEKWMIEAVARKAPTWASHMAVQTNDPQTLAYALADSPIGTAAWIWERRRAFSDCDGHIEKIHDRDALCTMASIYWLNGSIATSMRIYRELALRGWPALRTEGKVIEAPTGFAFGPGELCIGPRARAERLTNLHRWSVLPAGGHFLPAEQPAALVDEYRAFFGSLR